MEKGWSNDTLTTKMKVLCASVKDLKTMRKYVYGAVALFSICVVIGLGLRADIQSANANTKMVREKHVKEYRDLDNSFDEKLDKLEENINKSLLNIGIEIGKNEGAHIRISERLSNIERKLDDIATWQREQK
jgi:hypothetical protein